MELGTTTGRAKIGNQKSNFRNGNKDREGKNRPGKGQKQFFENLIFSKIVKGLTIHRKPNFP